MKTFTHLLCVLILSIVLFACNNAHFLKEESYRNQVAQDFEQKKRAFPHGDLFAIFGDSALSVYEREALMFLYAYMPIGVWGIEPVSYTHLTLPTIYSV